MQPWFNGQPPFARAAYTPFVRTLFLDFDGVLHPEFCHESRHFSCLPAFEHVLRQVPDCDVVITSIWRFQMPPESLRARFSPDVATRVIGVTPERSQLTDLPGSLLSFEREAECHAWLRANGRSALPWLAIDDRPWLYRPFCPTLFLVDGKQGLTMPVAEALIARLGKL